MTTIEHNALLFNELQEVLIPESVKNIGITAFRYNKIPQGKAKIDNVKNSVQIGLEAFADNGEDGATEIIPVYLKSQENVTWIAEDFEFYDDLIVGTDKDGTGFPDVNYTLRGFSKKGSKKFDKMKNKPVVLPSRTDNGEQVVGIVIQRCILL